MHPLPGNWVAIDRAVVCYAYADQASSTYIQCSLNRAEKFSVAQ